MISAFHGDFEGKQVKTVIKSIRLTLMSLYSGNLSFAAYLGVIHEGLYMKHYSKP